MSLVTFNDVMPLNGKRILTVDTYNGYLQVLEYILQDCTYLHVVQWHTSILDSDNLIPNQYNKTFYACKDMALEFAVNIANELLKYN